MPAPELEPPLRLWTYRHLTQPIPPNQNLANIRTTPASPPCPTCLHLLKQSSNRICNNNNNKLNTHGATQLEIPVDEWHLTDTFPAFPTLAAAAAAATGCTFCTLLRSTIISAWGRGNMLESGAMPLLEEDDSYEQLFAAAWDGKVEVHRARFLFRSFGVGGEVFHSHDRQPEGGQRVGTGGNMTRNEVVDGALEQGGGVVVGLEVEFGPAAVPVGEEGEEIGGELGAVLGFGVFDSVDLESPVPASRRRLPSDRTLSERNVELIKGWIDGCVVSHGSACQADASWTPARLLDVDELRLVETENGAASSGLRYAALSYARGNAGPDTGVQTSAENLDDRKEGIDLADLPRAFRDAVAVCQALGIRYLWVDALCILDDAEDLNREVSVMHKTFGHAQVTIAATSATSPQSGFLTRNLSATPAAKIGDKERYIILTLQEHKTNGTRASDVDRSPWNQDAWALAERMLSARVVHFAKNKLYFECRRALCSEENDAETTALKPSGFWPRVEEQGAEAERYRAFLYEHWRAFVAEYSSRQLSRKRANNSSKLLPVRAVAEAMAAVISDEYLRSAGMWKGDLAAQLLWYVTEDDDGAVRAMPRAKQAPTWSWAYRDAKVGFVRGTTDGAPPSALNKQRFHVAEVLEGSSLSLHGYGREISALRSIDARDAWLAEMRKEYPWDLLVSESDGDEAACVAHGALDDPDELISAYTRLMYLHVADEVHPTGLILARDSRLGSAWRRIGVATIFELGDLIMDPPFGTDSFTHVVVE